MDDGAAEGWPGAWHAAGAAGSAAIAYARMPGRHVHNCTTGSRLVCKIVTGKVQNTARNTAELIQQVCEQDCHVP